MKIKRIKKGLVIGILVVYLLTMIMAALVYNRVIKLNHPSGLKGADVSSYQGQTDWAVLSKQMDFVFVKATEGSGSTDEMFIHNFNGAMEAGLYTGAYHFFSYDSSGSTQAENFITALESTAKTDGMLPPVLDVELYGSYSVSPKQAKEVVPEIKTMISMIEEKYGVKPIIYCTGKTYSRYGAAFEGCLLWRRNVYFHPFSRDWTFWQYSDTECFEGYHGEEKFIDMNVFSGSREELEALLISRK